MTKEKGTNIDIKAYENAGFKHWTKGGHDRLYIDAESLGLEIERYKTGNVRSATWQGNRISNADGRRLIASKIYVDVKTRELHVNTEFDSYDYPLTEIAQALVDNIEANLETHTTEKSEQEETMTKSRLSASLSLAMRRRKMNQTELAEMSNVPQPTISRILSGEDESLIRLGTVEKIKRALGCTWDDLLGK